MDSVELDNLISKIWMQHGDVLEYLEKNKPHKLGYITDYIHSSIFLNDMNKILGDRFGVQLERKKSDQKYTTFIVDMWRSVAPGLYFEVELMETKCTLKLVLGPDDQEKRQTIYNALEGHGVCDRLRNGSISKEFTTITIQKAIDKKTMLRLVEEAYNLDESEKISVNISLRNKTLQFLTRVIPAVAEALETPGSEV